MATTTAVRPLRRRMIDDMMLRNLSPTNQRSHLHAVTKFGRYFGGSPDRLALEDARRISASINMRCAPDITGIAKWPWFWPTPHSSPSSSQISATLPGA